MHLTKLMLPILASFGDTQITREEALARGMQVIDQICAPTTPTLHGIKRQFKAEMLKSSNSNGLSEAELLCCLKIAAMKGSLGAISQLNQLPRVLGALSSLDLLNIHYLVAYAQTNGWTCGYWALWNSAAIHALIREGVTVLTNEAIIARASRFCNTHPTTIQDCIAYINQFFVNEADRLQEEENTQTHHLLRLSQMAQLGVGALHFMGFGHEVGQLYFDPADLDIPEALHVPNLHGVQFNPQEVQVLLEEFILEKFARDHVRPNRSGALHFICHLRTPALHWLLVSVIKLPDRKPFMVLLDSYNFNISESVDAGTIIPFLYDRFVRPFA